MKPEELWGKQHTDAILAHVATGLTPERHAIELFTGPWPVMPLTICHELSRMTSFGYSFWVGHWAQKCPRCKCDMHAVNSTGTCNNCWVETHY